MKNEISKIDKHSSVVIADTTVNQPSSHTRDTIVYALIYIIITAAISFTLGVTVVPGITALKSIIIPACSYTLLGILFAAFLYARFRFLSRSNYTGGLTYAFIVFTGVFATSLSISLIKGHGSGITSLFYSSLFILPFTIYQTWIFYDRLSFISYNKIWYLPEHGSEIHRATVFLNSIQIKIKMAPVYGAAEQIYETTVPGRMSVGNMFDNFVNNESGIEENKVILDDLSSQYFGWQFFSTSFLGLGTRLIDADLSLDENKIKSNSVVVARRIPKQFAITNTANQN